LVEWITGACPKAEPDTNDHNGIQLPSPGSRIGSSARRAAPGSMNRDHRGLLESLLWYGTNYGPGDPLR
jgi:hypothetical protein